MLSKIGANLELLGTITQTLLAILPVLTGLLAWLHLRLRHQLRFLILMRRLRYLAKYLSARQTAFAAVDMPAQLRHEALEARIAKELGVALFPDSLSFNSLWHPLDTEFLKRANRQLASAAFLSFVDDLLRWLIISLDDLLEIQKFRVRMTGGLTEHSAMSDQEKLDLLHWQWREAIVRIERHMLVMKQYLAGQVEADICPDTQKRMVRQILIEEGEAFAKLRLDDQERQAG